MLELTHRENAEFCCILSGGESSESSMKGTGRNFTEALSALAHRIAENGNIETLEEVQSQEVVGVAWQVKELARITTRHLQTANAVEALTNIGRW